MERCDVHVDDALSDDSSLADEYPCNCSTVSVRAAPKLAQRLKNDIFTTLKIKLL